MAQLASHLVVALIALVVIGGATRVMEAGLACPDWPLCYGSFFPGNQMNVQVFLEWLHRLDAFLVGTALLAQLWISIVWHNHLPNWFPWACASLLLLVAIQGGLGAMTVLQLLPTTVVTAHLAVALVLVAVMSGLTQILLSPSSFADVPIWWRMMGGVALLSVFAQSLIGARMATSWGAQRCLLQLQDCQLLDFHRGFAGIASILILVFIVTSIVFGGWPRSQWPFFAAISGLVFGQITLGLISVKLDLSQPFLTIGHQLLAVLLVAFLAALTFKSPVTFVQYHPTSTLNLF